MMELRHMFFLLVPKINQNVHEGIKNIKIHRTKRIGDDNIPQNIYIYIYISQTLEARSRDMKGNCFISRMEKQNLTICRGAVRNLYFSFTPFISHGHMIFSPQILAGGKKRMYVGGLVGGYRCTLCVCVCMCAHMCVLVCVCVYKI